MSIAENDEGQFEKTEILIDWRSSDFSPGNLITDVPIICNHSFVEKQATGLSLRLSSADKDEWSARGFAYLQRQLAILTANRGNKRKGYKKDTGFNIKLDAPDLATSETTDLREELYNAG